VSAIRWTERAAADLISIGDHIAADNPAVARAWVERLRKRAVDAAENPRAGRVVPESGQGEIREVLVRSYRIVYRVESGGIAVLTVFEGHRLIGEIGPA
jgi:toxin ParE1/3/4